MSFHRLYQTCRLCPRQCGVDRVQNNTPGYCGETHQVRVGYMGPHFGEEPPISGKNGSGTVFFSGCSLKCSFCQNRQISHAGMGEAISPLEFSRKLERMIQNHGVHNINFVTPDHFFPHVAEAVATLREKGMDIPVIFNTSGFQSLELLSYAKDYVDIYLPDFKYSDALLASNISKCLDYPETALVALEEMIRQKGFLDIFDSGAEFSKKGVLVRHLILPGHVDNSLDAFTTLFLEFGKKLPLSLMSQYWPVIHQSDSDLNRTLTQKEFEAVYHHVLDLGFENLFVQFFQEDTINTPGKPTFLPDFEKTAPFGG